MSLRSIEVQNRNASLRTRTRGIGGGWLTCCVSVGMVAGLGTFGCAADPATEHDIASAGLTADVRLLDTPSPAPISLRPTSAMDGAKSLSSLDFELENTTGEVIDVDLQVVGYDGNQAIARQLPKLRAQGKQRASNSVAVQDLPVQHVGVSVPTMVFARYTMADGKERSAILETAYVTHEPGYQKAFVRSAAAEASVGGARVHAAAAAAAGTATAAAATAGASAAAPQGRAWNATTQAFGAATGTGPSSRAQLVTQTADMPDPTDPKYQSASGAPAATNLVQKANNYSVCVKMPYWYYDVGKGEDYLIGQTNTTTGFEPAHYMFGYLVDSAGGIGFSGYLDQNGCTPVFAHSAGLTYTMSVTSALSRPVGSGSTLVYVNNDTQGLWVYYSQAYTISQGTSGTMYIQMPGGISYDMNAAVVASNILYRQGDSFGWSTQTNLYTKMTCPRAATDSRYAGSACAVGSNIYYGDNKAGTAYVLYKYVVAHEFGHTVQTNLFGLQSAPYTIDQGTPRLCQCTQVTSSNQIHCLQSREETNGAQVEGFAHFYASDGMNIPSQSDCVFVYYKEFLWSENPDVVWYPPIGATCINQVRWMEAKCSTGMGGRGVEYDWLTFYYNVIRKSANAIGYGGLQSVYLKACGGGLCTGKTTETSWTPLVSAANSVWGTNTAKALYWKNTGVSYGVAH